MKSINFDKHVHKLYKDWMGHFFLKMLIFMVSLILGFSSADAIGNSLLNQVPSWKEQGIAQYRLGTLFSQKKNWEKAHSWFQHAASLAYEREDPQAVKFLGKKQYQLAQSFWNQSLPQYAGYWFQKAATHYYAQYYQSHRLPNYIPKLEPVHRTGVANKSFSLPLGQPLNLLTETGSISLSQVRLTEHTQKAIRGEITNNSPLRIKKLSLRGFLYDSEGRLFKATSIHGYASTIVENLEHDRPQAFQIPVSMHESLASAARVSFEVAQIQYDDIFYITEGHARQHPIMIYDLHPTPPNSQESVSLKISWVNSGKKEIQRIAFRVEPYATGSLRVRGKIRQKSQIWIEHKGPFPFGHHVSGHLWENVWYNQAIVCVRMTAIEIEFQDHTVFKAIQRKPSKHFFYPNTYPQCTYEDQSFSE